MTLLRAVRTVVSVAAVVLGAAHAQAACTVADIEVKEWKWSRDAGWFSIEGALVNNCAEPAAPQIQVTFRDETGQVVNIDESWPVGTRNIPAKGTYVFKTSTRGYATAKNLSIRVVNVRQWP